MKRYLKRVTVKVPGDVYFKLRKMRERSGIPISILVSQAVFTYAKVHHRGPGRPPGTKRGSR